MGHRGAGTVFDQLILKRGLGCSLFNHTRDMEGEPQLLANDQSFVKLQIELGSVIIFPMELTSLKSDC